MLDVARTVLDRGFAIVPNLIDGETATRLIAGVEARQEAEAALRRGQQLYGMRDLLRAVAEVRALAESPALLGLVTGVLGPGAFAVRGLWFDKTPGANWGVPWHQDLTIAVRERVETPGFGPWTVKAGIPHVRPPIDVLAGMLTVRVHLDDCGPEDGPLRAVPGSDRSGRLDAEATRRLLEAGPVADCLVARGGAVLMRPLLLHASEASTRPTHRRVVHLEYAAQPLPEPLHWFEAIGLSSTGPA